MKITFAMARKEWMGKLADLGWVIHLNSSTNGNVLKVPYATKTGCETVFFHPQAVHQGSDRSSARSVTSDVRNLNDIRHIKGY